jgi:hypothetical protein
MAEWWWGGKAPLQRFALFKDPATPVDATNPLPFSGKVAGAGVSASAQFMPAAAAYSAGDIVSVAQEFAFTFADGSPVPAGSLIRILSSVLKINQTALQASETSYSLALYSVTPPSAQADNAAWTLATGDLASYRDTLLLGTPVDLGSACYIKTQLTDKQDVKLSGTSLFGELITAGAPTFNAVAREVFLYGVVL